MTAEYAVDRSSGWWQWSATTLWITLVVVGTIGLLIERGDTVVSGRFVAGVAGGLVLVSAVVGWLLWRTESQPITVATIVTLSRGAVLAVFTGLLAGGQPAGSGWVPATLFALAAGLDAVDGRLARATDSVSELGARLDTEIDGLTVLLGATFAVAFGLVPLAFLIVGIARYAFVAGIWLRKRRGLPIEELPPSQLRRVLGGLAMGTIWVALLPVPGPAISRPLALMVSVPFVFNFGRDWQSVSGRR